MEEEDGARGGSHGGAGAAGQGGPAAKRPLAIGVVPNARCQHLLRRLATAAAAVAMLAAVLALYWAYDRITVLGKVRIG